MFRLRAAERSGRILVCGALCLLISGCVMIESYYQPLPKQGKVLQSFVTWNRNDDLSVPLGQSGDWTVYQRFEGWDNLLSVQVWLSIDPAKQFNLTSDDVTVVAGEQQYVHKLMESRVKGAPNLRREGRFEVNFGAEAVPGFSLVLPEVAIDNQTIATKPLEFKKKKGPVFYRILQ